MLNKIIFFSKFFIRTALVLIGLIIYLLTNRTPKIAYSSFVWMHSNTCGRSTDWLAKLMSHKKSYLNLELNDGGVIGKISKDKIKKICNSIKHNGYYIFDSKLPKDICEDLINFSYSINATVEKDEDNESIQLKYDASSPVSSTYRFSEQDLVLNNIVQKLMAEPAFLEIAQEYLSTRPILDSVKMWWTACYGNAPSSKAAQLFHFDLDRIKWLKFFFYLTDVDTNGSPHCYVKGSHNNKSKNTAELLKRGYVRLQDHEIEAAFGKEKIVEITGCAGTIVAVDTRGFHKGKLPKNSDRLALEFEFSNSLFGGAVENPYLVDDKLKVLKSSILKWPYIYKRFRLV